MKLENSALLAFTVWWLAEAGKQNDIFTLGQI